MAKLVLAIILAAAVVFLGKRLYSTPFHFVSDFSINRDLNLIFFCLNKLYLVSAKKSGDVTELQIGVKVNTILLYILLRE
jgi:hypothetical protein